MCIYGDDIKPACGHASAKMTLHQGRKEKTGGTRQAQLLATVYTGGGSAEMFAGTPAHFDESQCTLIVEYQVNFTRLAAQVLSKKSGSCRFQMLPGLAFRLEANFLAG